jgi:hypothetical protein
MQACPAGTPTTVSGKVYTPAKTNADPLYNAVVYIPSAPVEPFSKGVTCDKCGNVSGKPIAAALSGPDGKFVLDDLPVGHDVPMVVQLGRWRRQVKIPEVKPCVDNPLPAELTRFARNQSEGDIPLIALVSSGYDPVECILRKIGIDDSEFTLPDKGGRVQVFVGTGANAGAGSTAGNALWNDPAKLKNYDMTLLPCLSTPEGLENPIDVIIGPGDPTSPTGDAARKNLVDYAGIGGRIFLTDLSYTWISQAPGPFGKAAKWYANAAEDEPIEEPLHVFIDTTFPKGDALATWLQDVKATTTKGELDISEPYHRSDAVVAPTQRWLYSQAPGTPTLQQLTFNAPVDAKPDDQCGRVFYSGFHIAHATGVLTDPDSEMGNGVAFPTECTPDPLTPQERVLEFMLFDLASCVQIDTAPPEPPPEIAR